MIVAEFLQLCALPTA